MTYPKRLIEVDLPIKRISAHARREKSIRHGHISTLHIWWARRPLAACRAVLCAALWPDPADPLCPEGFREAAVEALQAFAQKVVCDRNLAKSCTPETFGEWNTLTRAEARLDPQKDGHLNLLRNLLLDFIADFANWDNSTVPAYLETARTLTQSAHEALGGEPGTRPLVVDPFAGGGSIPLEALRVGADAFASDLNPVAVLLNKVVLEYIPKYGQRLAEEVRRWGAWVKEEAEKELAAFYPDDPDGAKPIAYLWARTILCEGPGCGVEVPLIRSLWLVEKAKRSIALRLVPNSADRRVDFEIIENAKAVDVGEGTVRRSSATCPCCGYTTRPSGVRSQLATRRGGANDARLLCVVTTKEGQRGRAYRLPNEGDLRAVEAAGASLERRVQGSNEASSLPTEPTPDGIGSGAGRAFSQRNYGMTEFKDVYTNRQLIAMDRFATQIRDGEAKQMPPLVRVLLGFALGRVNDLSMSLCRWLPSLEAVAAANGGQNRMPVPLDFVEINPLGGAGGDWSGQVDWVMRVVDHVSTSLCQGGTALRAAAQEPALPDDTAQALITDPPYYDAFPYSDLSDFFYIWLKRAVAKRDLGYEGELVPKVDEIVVYDVPHGDDGRIKDNRFFRDETTRTLHNWRKVVVPSGIGVVVFANKTTQGWEALVDSIIEAGWVVTSSWPLDTERPSRQRAQKSAALASSVHLVCRPRESPDGSLRGDDVGDWRTVLAELPKRIHEWMPRLAHEGVVGADAIFACLGPALEIFSRYSRVERANGDIVPLGEYLEVVWAAVAREALSMVFEDADASGLEPDARITAMWLWTLASANGAPQPSGAGGRAGEDGGKAGGYMLEYDAARKIAQGLGAHLETLSSVVEVKGGTARLLPVSERAGFLFGGTATPARSKGRTVDQLSFATLEAAEDIPAGFMDMEAAAATASGTVLDRLHQAMLLFSSGRGDVLKRFVVEEGAGRDARFWRLAQALSALYPVRSDEKRWVDGVLARKKGLGL